MSPAVTAVGPFRATEDFDWYPNLPPLPKGFAYARECRYVAGSPSTCLRNHPPSASEAVAHKRIPS